MEECCRVCGKGTDLKRCGRCKTAVYCSVEHQRSDWSFHKLFCKNFEKVSIKNYLKLVSDEIKIFRADLARKINTKKQSSELYEALAECIQKINPKEVILVKVGNNKQRSYLHALAKHENLHSHGCNYSGFDTNYMYQCKFCKTIYADNELTWHSDYGFTTGSYMGSYAYCYCADSDDDPIYYSGDYEIPNNEQDFKRWVGLNSVVISSAPIVLVQKKKKYGKRTDKSYEPENLEDIAKKINAIHDWKIEIHAFEEVRDKIESPKY